MTAFPFEAPFVGIDPQACAVLAEAEGFLKAAAAAVDLEPITIDDLTSEDDSGHGGNDDLRVPPPNTANLRALGALRDYEPDEHAHPFTIAAPPLHLPSPTPALNGAQVAMLAHCAATAAESPHDTYCTGTCRFGQCHPRCFDCSGFVYMMYQYVHITIDADTSLISRTGREQFQIRSVGDAIPCDLMIHATNGDPYNSSGAVGHVGIFVQFEWINGVLYVWTWESASSHEGVGLYRRPASFWLISVRIPALQSVGGQPVPVPPEEEDMQGRFYRGDGPVGTAAKPGPGSPVYLVTQGQYKRWMHDKDEMKFNLNAGWLDGDAAVHVVPQMFIDRYVLIGEKPPGA